MSAPRLHPWLLRVVWGLLPFTVGPALATALDGRSASVRTVTSGGLWAVWAVVLVATLVPHPVGLTALRVTAPAMLGAASLAALAPDRELVPAALAVAWAVATTAVVYSPATGFWAVNGPAYGDERRFLLRAPGPLLLGPLALAWALALAPLVAGVLLLAAERWVAGALCLVIGLPLAFVMLRAIHGLSTRWLVFVPNGLVIHDPLTLADPGTFRRQIVESLAPAPAGSDSLDLTQRAPGLALELVLREKVPLVLVKPFDKRGESGSSARMLVTPTRPGAVLAEADRRRIGQGRPAGPRGPAQAAGAPPSTSSPS